MNKEEKNLVEYLKGLSGTRPNFPELAWNCEDEYIRLEKVNQQLLEALKVTRIMYFELLGWDRLNSMETNAIKVALNTVKQAIAAAEGDTDG